MIFSNSFNSAKGDSPYLDEDGQFLNPAYGKKPFNLFEDIRDKLIKAGIPPDEIVIVSDPKYDNDLRKEALFVDVNSGKVRIVLGTTAKMGVGVNAQERLYAEHHIDAPVRPMDMEQRVGRMVRPGNIFKTVHDMRYGMEGTADAMTYQMLTNKSKFIKQLMKSGTSERVIDDAAGEVVLDYDEMMASLSGSEYAIDKIKTDADIKREKTKRDIFNGKIIQTNRALRNYEDYLAQDKAALKQDKLLANKASETFPDGNITSLTASGQEKATEKFSEAADKYLERLNQRYEQSASKYARGEIQINGVPVELSLFHGIGGSDLYYSIPELGIVDRFNSQFDNGYRVASGKGVGLLASIRSKIGDVIERPDRTEEKIKNSEKNIEQLNGELKKTYDDTHLKALEKKSAELAQKMIEEGVKKEAAAAALRNEEKERGEEQTPGEYIRDQSNIKGALDFLDNMKAKGGRAMGLLIPIPPAVWNGAIDVIKNVLKATNSTQKAVRVASKYIVDRGGSEAQAKDFEQSMNEKLATMKVGKVSTVPDTEEALSQEDMLKSAEVIQGKLTTVTGLNPDEQALSSIDLADLTKKELHRYIEIGAVLAVDPNGVLTKDVNDFFNRVENRKNPKMGTAVPPGAGGPPAEPPITTGGDEEPIEPRKNIPQKENTAMSAEDDEVTVNPETPSQGRKNYSFIGNLKDIHVRNLEQLKSYSKDIENMDSLRKAIQLATSKSQSKVDLVFANQKINKVVGEQGYLTLRQALIESRLRGVRQRWNQWATQIRGASDNDIDDLFTAGTASPIYQRLADLQGYEDDINPQATILTYLDNGNYDDAREYMADMFDNAARNVAYYDTLNNGKTFDEMVGRNEDTGNFEFVDPKFEQAHQLYKQYIEKPFKESHETNDGVFSDALGPLDTYYPLTRAGDEGPKVYMPSKSKYNAPDNINNHFTSGQAEQYTAAIAALSKKLTASIKTNNKAAFINAIQEAGLMTKVGADADQHATIRIEGIDYAATKVPVSEARTITTGTNTIHLPVRYVMIPDFLYKEIKPFIEGDEASDDDKYSMMGYVLNTAVNLMLGGPGEAISHTYRLLAAITNSMPFMQEWAYNNGILGNAGGIIANNILVKKFVGMGKILFTNSGSEQFANDVMEMAKMGLIPEKTWTHTWSKEFAKDMGIDQTQFPLPFKDIAQGIWGTDKKEAWKKVFTKGRLFDFSPMLYGKNGFDLKARVVMYRLVKAMNPEATPEQQVKMQADMGQYTMALQGRIEKFIKRNGLAPFATFGRAFKRAGFKAIIGASPIPLDSPDFSQFFNGNDKGANARKFMFHKLAQLITNGILGYVALWALWHHSVTNKWPWDDKDSKLGKLPIPLAMKKTKWAKKYFYNQRTGAWDDIDMSFFNIPITRGLKATGADRFYQVHQLGGTFGQSAEAAQVQIVNSMIQPYANSPLISVPWTTATGAAPYLTTIRGYTGKDEPSFLRKVKTQQAGMQMPANFFAGMMGMNPLLEQGLNPVTGSVVDEYNEDDYQSGKFVKSLINIAMPGLTSPHGNDKKQADNIKKGAKAIQTTIKKESHKPVKK